MFISLLLYSLIQKIAILKNEKNGFFQSKYVFRGDTSCVNPHSGGLKMKKFTAIAILFSILRLKPMAFCVLDEIEAALDEANVDRFARYLQKFSEETQFIVITHRKPTMEMADALFGVTMQEKGVSKMVSVKLADVANITGDSALA